MLQCLRIRLSTIFAKLTGIGKMEVLRMALCPPSENTLLKAKVAEFLVVHMILNK